MVTGVAHVDVTVRKRRINVAGGCVSKIGGREASLSAAAFHPAHTHSTYSRRSGGTMTLAWLIW